MASSNNLTFSSPGVARHSLPNHDQSHGGPTISVYSKSDHVAYGYNYSIVAVGPPHSLVFQSFLDGDTKSTPLMTETTKRQCLLKTEQVLKPVKQVVEDEQRRGVPLGLSCKSCGNWNTYFVTLVCMLALTGVHAQFGLIDKAGSYVACCSNPVECDAYTSPISNLQAPVGICHIKFTLSQVLTYSTGPIGATGCILRDSEGVPIMQTNYPLTSGVTTINGVPGTIPTFSSITTSNEVLTQCNGEQFYLGPSSLDASICCTVNWAILSSQPVNITESITLPVNVTAFLGQVAVHLITWA